MLTSLEVEEQKSKSSKSRKKDKKDKHKSSKKKKKHREKEYKTQTQDDSKIIPDDNEKEIHDFKHAIQGKRPRSTDEGIIQPNLLYSSSTEIATKMGLPIGLLRTSISSTSMSEKYSKELFGGDDDNPAKRQRLKREMVAQRAIAKARSVIAERQAVDSSQSTPRGSSIGFDLSNRFT
jgi:hypothetical protein